MDRSDLLANRRDLLANRRDLLAALADYRSRQPNEGSVVDRFLALLEDEPRCFARDCFVPGHITGSAWLVDGTRKRVLLTHHKKLGRWLQLGGHADGDEDVLAVAMREAREESSLAVAPVDAAVFDIDIHEIPARSADPLHCHFDIRFALEATDSEAFRVSVESHDLRWVSIDALGDLTSEISMLRMASKWRERREPLRAR